MKKCLSYYSQVKDLQHTKGEKINVWLLIFLLLMISTALGLSGCSSKKEKHNDSEHEKTIKAILEREKEIIGTFDFNRKDVTKKGLLASEALSLSVHTWELYTYNGETVQRRMVVPIIEGIAKDLNIKIDEQIVINMKNREDFGTVQSVKDYFYDALYSENRLLEASIYMRALTRLYIGLALDGLQSAIEKNDARRIATGNMMLKQGIAITIQLAQQDPPPRDLQYKIMSIESAISSQPARSRERAEDLKREINEWFDAALKALLRDWGGKQMTKQNDT